MELFEDIEQNLQKLLVYKVFVDSCVNFVPLTVTCSSSSKYPSSLHISPALFSEILELPQGSCPIVENATPGRLKNLTKKSCKTTDEILAFIKDVGNVIYAMNDNKLTEIDIIINPKLGAFITKTNNKTQAFCKIVKNNLILNLKKIKKINNRCLFSGNKLLLWEKEPRELYWLISNIPMATIRNSSDLSKIKDIYQIFFDNALEFDVLTSEVQDELFNKQKEISVASAAFRTESFIENNEIYFKLFSIYSWGEVLYGDDNHNPRNRVCEQEAFELLPKNLKTTKNIDLAFKNSPINNDCLELEWHVNDLGNELCNVRVTGKIFDKIYSHKELCSFIERGDNIIKVSNIIHVNIPQKLYRAYNYLIFSSWKGKNKIKQKKLYLVAGIAENDKIVASGRNRDILDFLQSKKFHKSINTLEHDFQNFGATWLYGMNHHGWGGVLADEVGLGKRKQIFAFLKQIYAENPNLPDSLIVTPEPLIEHWLKEVPLKQVKVVSYQSIVKRPIKEHFHVLVWDEAILAVADSRFSACLSINGTSRFCLTSWEPAKYRKEFYRMFMLTAPKLVENIKDSSDELELDILTAPFILRRKGESLPYSEETITCKDIQKSLDALCRNLGDRKILIISDDIFNADFTFETIDEFDKGRLLVSYNEAERGLNLDENIPVFLINPDLNMKNALLGAYNHKTPKLIYKILNFRKN